MEKNDQGGVLRIRLMQREEIEMNNKQLQSGLCAKYNFQDICGESRLLQHAIHLAKRAAKTDSDILIEGESGTGKELLYNQFIMHRYVRKAHLLLLTVLRSQVLY